MMSRWTGAAVVSSLFLSGLAPAAEEWVQLKFAPRHDGDVPDRNVMVPLGLIGAVPLTDAVLTSPVVADDRVYVVDAAGVASAIDTATLEIVWRRTTRGGRNHRMGHDDRRLHHHRRNSRPLP